MKNTLILIMTSLFFMGCTLEKDVRLKKNDGKIPIVTSNEMLAIHTRMIASDHAFVVALPLESSLKLSEKSTLHNASIMITDNTEKNTVLQKALQKFRGTHLYLGERESVFVPKKDQVLKDVEKIRDTLVELDPQHRGSYYDNAGSYIHLINQTYDKLEKRLTEYKFKNFISLGKNIGNMLDDFGISKYQFKHFDTRDDLEKMIIKTNTISPILLITPDIPKYSLKNMPNKIQWEMYFFTPLENDTTEWGYIRFVENNIGTIIAAFDTYD